MSTLGIRGHRTRVGVHRADVDNIADILNTVRANASRPIKQSEVADISSR